jgi:hypothetical protein
MDVDLRKRIGGQEDLVAAWQLRAEGWSRQRIQHWCHKEGWRQIHDGVWAVGHAPLSRRQRWIAAVLTAPNTFLAGHAAGLCHGFAEGEPNRVCVVRPGSGGPRRYPGLLVTRSTVLEGHTTHLDGIPILTAPRALIDHTRGLRPWQRGRAFRESIRLRTTTADEIAKTILALRGRRGTRALAALCDRYATIPYHRCRSDAEGRALEILHDAGLPAPQVNVRVATREADLVWRRRKLIVEVDSMEYHQFTDQDLEKQALWEGAGYVVRRIWANDVYFRSKMFLALVNVPTVNP